MGINRNKNKHKIDKQWSLQFCFIPVQMQEITINKNVNVIYNNYTKRSTSILFLLTFQPLNSRVEFIHFFRASESFLSNLLRVTVAFAPLITLEKRRELEFYRLYNFNPLTYDWLTLRAQWDFHSRRFSLRGKVSLLISNYRKSFRTNLI